MADNTVSISPTFKFEVKTPPRGMTDYDFLALHPDQQSQLSAYRLNLMRENVKFLARHCEIEPILRWIGQFVWKVRANNILEKVGKISMIPEPVLRRQVKEASIRTSDDIEPEDPEWDY